MNALFAEYLEFLQTNWIDVVTIYLALWAWLWSGCFAASVAEQRRRGPLVHFLLGLAIPCVYPIYILFKLELPADEEAVKDKKETKFERIDGPPPVDSAPPPMLSDESRIGSGYIDETVLERKVAYGETFFKAKSMDDSGRALGPYILTVAGDELRAERIVEVLPNALVIEIVSAGGKSQTLRIPYARIESCVDA